MAQEMSGSLSQGVTSGLSFLIYNPPSQTGMPAIGPQAPQAMGLSETMNLLAPGTATSSGLSLAGAALFAGPTNNSTQQAQKQAINQTLGYQSGGLKLSIDYVNVGKQFSIDPTQAASAGLTGNMSNSLLGFKGQNGINTGLNYTEGADKFGFSFSSITDSLHSQHKTSEIMSMEHDFNKSLAMTFQSTEATAEQLSGGTASHQTTNILHLAYSPTRSGFLLDGTTTQTLNGQGAETDDMKLSVARNFSTLNLSSQFESNSNKSSGTSNGWTVEKFNASDMLGKGVKVTSFWDQKSNSDGSGNNDFDVILNSTENRYVELAAEYAKSDVSNAAGTSKSSLVANVKPGTVGIFGPLLLTLSYSSHQTAFLAGYQSYSAALSGQITHAKAFDFGLMGAKYYLAYSDASSQNAGSADAVHSARTLRLVSGPSGSNGLSWTVMQQQRLDGNGQPLRTSSDYEVKYNLNRHISVAGNSTFETAQANGAFSDRDAQGLGITLNTGLSTAIIASYVHSKCPSANINGEDDYTMTDSGVLFGKQGALGLGEDTKSDISDRYAYGASANVQYNWKADADNLLNLSSKFTDWQNCGYNNQDDNTVEAAGQINYQRVF
jgi:hypothetical protein